MFLTGAPAKLADHLPLPPVFSSDPGSTIHRT